MSDPQLTHLLDRAVHHAPPMHLDGEHLLAAGRGRVRRRRVLGAGGGLAAVALVTALWGGLAGGDGFDDGQTPIQPATTVWEQGEAVDATLFTGFGTIDADQVGHSFDGRLTRPDLDGPVVLELSDHGQVVEQIPARSPQPGLEVFAGERMTVAVWAEPEGVVSAVPLVGPVDPGGPTTRTGIELDDARYGYSVWPADVTGFVRPEEVLDVYLVGEDEVVAVSGASVETAVLQAGEARAVTWSDVERGAWGYAVGGKNVMLDQLGDQPAQVSSASWNEDDRETSVSLLPEGAELVGVQRGEVSSTTLAGRPVVLTEASNADSLEIAFRLGDHTYDLADYVTDLSTLELGGETASLSHSEGGLELLTTTRSVPLLRLAADELDRGRLVVPTTGGPPVVVTTGWDPGAGVLADARLEVTEQGVSRWGAPGDVAQVTVPDGRLVTVLTVDEAQAAGVTVTGVGVAVGAEDDSIVRWDRWEPLLVSADGVDWQEVEGQVVPFVDGEPLDDLGIASLGAARLYAAPDSRSADLLVLPLGLGVEDRVLPLLRKGDSLDPAPWVLGDTRVVETSSGPVLVVETEPGMLTEGTRLAARWASALRDGAANVWAVLGGADVLDLDGVTGRSAHLAIQGGLVVTVGGPEAGDPWLFYPQGDDSWGETSTSLAVRAGVVGATLLELVDETDPQRLHVAAVLPEGSGAELVLAPGARLVSTESHAGPLDGLEVVTAVVDLGDLAPADAVGLDLDGDGAANLRLPMRG